MARVNNYLVQAAQAKAHFLEYDQQKLIQKLKLRADEDWLYTPFMGQLHRIHRKTGDIFRQEGTAWKDANSFEEVLTLLDLVCDSRADRFLTGRWKNLQSFGNQFHRNLLEDQESPFARAIQDHPEAFRGACRALGGKEVKSADIAYSVELFDGLPIGVFFWEGDEEFAPRIRYYLDENAAMYLRYETMHYAVGLLAEKIMERMR